MTEEFPCGTYPAYQRHRRRHEPACDACKEANAERSRKLRSDPAVMQEQYARNNARIKALWRLSHEYPERFRQLVLEELTKLTFPEG